KKFTWNTWCQTSMVVSSEPSRAPASALGEMAALLTSACNSLLSSRRLISSIASSVLASSARSTWMWSSGPASHGQFSGNGWREQVITRQPAAENRLTVAWPIPRLAPVKSSVLRGRLVGDVGISDLKHPSSGTSDASSRIKPRLAPRRAQVFPPEFDAIVQAERPLVPELDAQGQNSVTRPMRRPRHRHQRVFGGVQRNRLLESEPAFERGGLLAGPSADLGLLRAGGEIGVGLGIRHMLSITANAHLPVQRLPIKNQGGLRVNAQFSALL